MKRFIKEVLQNFKIFNLQKILNLNKYNKIHCEGTYNYKQAIKLFSVDKFKTYFGAYYTDLIQPIKKLKSCIDTVNKIFDGNVGKTILDNFYYKTGFVDKIFTDNDGGGLRKINLYKKEKYGRSSTINFYNNGFCWYPLVSNESFNSDSYIYTIYKYLYIKTNNTYTACFIALFYYYVGKLFSLIKVYKKNDINVLESNLSSLIAKLSSFVSIINRDNVTCCLPQLVSIKLINIINTSLLLSGAEFYKYRPYLIGLTKYILTINGVFSKLSFQETLKTLKNIIFEHKIDWKVDSKSNIIVSDFIPVGSGWYRYFIN